MRSSPPLFLSSPKVTIKLFLSPRCDEVYVNKKTFPKEYSENGVDDKTIKTKNFITKKKRRKIKKKKRKSREVTFTV